MKQILFVEDIDGVRYHASEFFAPLASMSDKTAKAEIIQAAGIAAVKTTDREEAAK